MAPDDYRPQLHVHWQDEIDSDLDALVPRVVTAGKSNSTRRSKKKQVRRLVAFASVAAAFLVLLSLPGQTSQDTPLKKQKLAPVLNEKGWVQAVRQYRQEFAELVIRMKRLEDKAGISDSEYADISPVYDKIEYALRTFGVRSVYTELFENLEYYYPEKWHKNKNDCDSHGMQCYWQDPWWLWHYVGAISAELLLQEGSLLLDGITGERIDDAVSVMKEIHRIQEEPYVSAMSFHAEHGFIWMYIATTQPDITEYPSELSEEFCGSYKNRKVSARPAGKTIGYECYHGFGHAVYSVIAMRQMQASGNFSSYSARKQIRPHGGFALTDESFCTAFNMCDSAPKDTKAPEKACFGGIRHSYKLFSNSLPKFATKYDNQRYFIDLYDRVC